MNVFDFCRDHAPVLVLGHRVPDGDCIGSMSGLVYWLRDMGIEADGLLQNIPEVYRQYSDGMYEGSLPESIKAPNGIVCVDTNELGRVYGLDSSYAHLPVYQIDHHKDNTEFGTYNYVDRGRASNAEIMAELFVDEVSHVTSKVANALYLGVVCDTYAFKVGSVDSECMKAAAFLLGRGAEHEKVMDTFYLLSKQKYALRNHVIRAGLSSSFTTEKVLFLTVSSDELDRFDADLGDAKMCIPSAMDIGGFDIICLIGERSDGFFVSLRSKGDIDVSVVAQKLGGGGHKNASGAVVHGGAFMDVVSRVLAGME